jgi:hypothetical protein
MEKKLKTLGLWSAVLAFALTTIVLPTRAAAQDDQPQQDDPPSRVARLGYMEGSVSLEPAGEQDWVGADDNRPMTTGDKIWADKASRAELQLGSAVIRLSENTGVSFLNLDDRTAQVQLSSGVINIQVRRLDRDDVYEIDTPNLAFTITQPGKYRIQASEDGSNTVVTIREGNGEATGNGQTYSVHAGQSATFSGTDSLNADVEQIAAPDQFDTWADSRENRHEHSRSAQYLSADVVGYDDLDDNGDWRDERDYGHVWYPHVEAGWAPYREGHWAWIDPWGYTWVDDSPWGYAPFHYGRWVSVSGRWGWVAGPREERAVYAPALVVFVGGGGGFGGNVGWFPLGPREVYVPSYPVSRAYVNRVNISSTTVNTTVINNVYNTTVINKTTNVTNVTYVNRNVQGGMTAVPQRAFASAQPVARAAVQVNAREVAAAPVMHRVAVNPTREAVLGAKASSANRVTAPPAAVANRQVIAKQAPPPPPPAFAARQQAMAAHPGQPLPKRELASLRPAPSAAAATHPAVKVAPPGKPATPTTGQPANNAARPGQPAPGAPANQPANRPGNQPNPNERPGAANAAQPNQPEANRPGQPNRPEPNQPNRPPAAQPNNRPEPNQPNRPPAAQPNNRPEPNQPNRPPAAQPNNRPEPNQPNNPNRPSAAQPDNRPEPSQPNRPPAAQPNNRPEPNQPNRPPAAQPNNRPEPSQPNRPPAAQPNNRPEPSQPNRPAAAQPNNRPEPNRPPAAQPEPRRNEPPARQQPPPQAERPQQQQRTPPPEASKPAPPQNRPPAKQQTPEEKKKQEEKKPPGV